MLENFYLTLMGAWDSFRASFYLNFIEDDRWHYIVDGLGVTLQITLFAVFLGIVIGLVVGIIRTTYEKTHKLKILNLICGLFRSGIQSVDSGQMEAGRSLGFNYLQTMRYIILPQAFKNVLPTLCNEFISLLKETSVSGYIAIQDLTKGGDIIRSRTYSAFMPLLAVALIYLVIVLILSRLIGILERRLRRSER